MTLPRLMVAFDGTELPRSAASRISEHGVAGVTLFPFLNVADPAQVRRLTAAIQEAKQKAKESLVPSQMRREPEKIPAV